MTEKRFSLFNTSRWGEDSTRPACCHVVPVLAIGLITEIDVRGTLESLRVNGSVAAPGYDQPEGIVIYHSPSRNFYKMTLDKNDEHKGV